MSVFIQIPILKGTLFRNLTLSWCDEMGVMMKSVPLSSFVFPEVAEIITFVDGNRIHVEPKFDERSTFIRDASTKFARRNYNMIVRICLLLQIS